MTDFTSYWAPTQNFDFRGRKVAYLEAGKGNSILFIHGHSGRLADWRPQLEHFAQSAHVVGIDLPGHGLSDIPSNTSMDYLVEAVEALLEHLDISKATVAGHSMGGRIALHLARRNPLWIDRIVLANAPADQPLPPSLRLLVRTLPTSVNVTAMRFRPAMKILMQRYSSGLVKIRNPYIEEKLEYIRWARTQPEFADRLRYFIKLGKSVVTDRTESILKHIRQPALVLWGREDPTTPEHSVEILKKGLAHVKFEALDCSHSPQLELPEYTNRLIESFIQRRR